MAALMAVSEMPELLTLTDDVSNDYVFARVGFESPRPGAVKAPSKATVASAAFNLPVRLLATVASNSLISPAAKALRGLLTLLVTFRN